MYLWSQLLERLRQNCLNTGGRGCSELRSRHCTPPGWQCETLSQKKRNVATVTFNFSQFTFKQPHVTPNYLMDSASLEDLLPSTWLTRNHFQFGTVAHTCNPRTLGGQGGWIAWTQGSKTSLGNGVKLCLKKVQREKIEINRRKELKLRAEINDLGNRKY